MVVDEAWRYLQDPAVLSYLAEAAKTWRKKNAALIVATQSAVDVTGTHRGRRRFWNPCRPNSFLPIPISPRKPPRRSGLNRVGSEHHSGVDPQTGTVSPPHRCGGDPAPGSRSGELLALYLVAS